MRVVIATAGVAVAVFASNCKKAGASERYKYLEELMRYIPVRWQLAITSMLQLIPSPTFLLLLLL